MRCPHCQEDSIPFFKVWVKSDFGSFKCPACGEVSSVVLSVPLVLTSISIGMVAVLLGIYFGSLIVFDAAFVVGVAVDAAITYRVRRLKMGGPVGRIKVFKNLTFWLVISLFALIVPVIIAASFFSAWLSWSGHRNVKLLQREYWEKRLQ